ncbi:MAG: hypothetical protein BWY70_00273 [Bacteroidetes bacterium ADurb.Bin408]|nr:MAG: hypothetical protein BWY70_00273 [Bacteroidetes bacterium ADurb.Bin408]
MDGALIYCFLYASGDAHEQFFYVRHQGHMSFMRLTISVKKLSQEYCFCHFERSEKSQLADN